MTILQLLTIPVLSIFLFKNRESARHSNACLRSQDMGDRGRHISVSSKLAWSTHWVLGQQDYKVRPSNKIHVYSKTEWRDIPLVKSTCCSLEYLGSIPSTHLEFTTVCGLRFQRIPKHLLNIPSVGTRHTWAHAGKTFTNMQRKSLKNQTKPNQTTEFIFFSCGFG